MSEENINDREESPPVFKARQPDEKVNVQEQDGSVQTYLIREMNDDDLNWWMGNIAKRVQANKGKKRDFRGFYADLIYLCLYDQSGRKVSKDHIKSWGTKLQSYLFSRCQAINGLSDDFEDEEGKA